MISGPGRGPGLGKVESTYQVAERSHTHQDKVFVYRMLRTDKLKAFSSAPVNGRRPRGKTDQAHLRYGPGTSQICCDHLSKDPSLSICQLLRFFSCRGSPPTRTPSVTIPAHRGPCHSGTNASVLALLGKLLPCLMPCPARMLFPKASSSRSCARKDSRPSESEDNTTECVCGTQSYFRRFIPPMPG